MLQNLLILLILASALFISTRLYATQGADIKNPSSPVVVELFTSQSCSSCPPADRLFETLADKENIIALGCHVSYWNHLRWKDTVSHDFCDMRQHGYSGMRGDKRVYTPQMIVNGTTQFVGSYAGKINAALKNAEKNPIKLIHMEQSGTKTLEFTLPNATQGNYRLWAYGYKKQVVQNIGSGENSGRKVNYANPVISYTNLGSWNGSAMVHKFDKPEEDIEGIAILAQRDGYGEIVAAGKLEF